MSARIHNPPELFPRYRCYSHAIEVAAGSRLLVISGLNFDLADGVTMPESLEEQAELPGGATQVSVRRRHRGAHSMGDHVRDRSSASSLIIAAIAACLSVSCSTHSNSVVGAGNVEDVLSVCELMQSSASLRNSIVKVRGEIVSGFEVFALVSDECSFDSRLGAMIWLETPGSNDSPYADGPSFSEFARAAGEGRLGELERTSTWIQPVPVTFEDDKQWRRMHRRLDAGWTVHATVTGRLDFAPERLLLRTPEGRLGLSGGFGHLNGYSRRLVIQRVENVE